MWLQQYKKDNKSTEELHTDFPTPACPLTTRTLFLLRPCKISMKKGKKKRNSQHQLSTNNIIDINFREQFIVTYISIT